MYFDILLISKNNIYYNKSAESVRLNSLNGELEIYSNHCSILFSIYNSILSIYLNKKFEYFYILNGLLEFNLNKLTILVENFIDSINLNKEEVFKKKREIEIKINKYKKNNINKYLNLLDKLLIYNKYIMYLDYIN